MGTALGLLNFAFFFGAAIFQGTGLLLGRFPSSAAGALPEPAYQALFAAFAVALVVAGACVAATREAAVEGAAPVRG
ncbi:MAG: hypothetical protein GEV08_10420 [Acidimicrobiia bacterium]|nr:hypothetical protein [Acidimicrobiia bacterium]